MSHSVELAGLTMPGTWMIAPRSFLVNRISPDLERVWFPDRHVGGGTVTLEQGTFTYPSLLQGTVRKLRRQFRDDPPITVPGPFLDLRPDNPDNWSHFLNKHLALLSLVCEQLELDWRKLTILLPWDMPGYIRELADFLGLTCIYTDRDVTGEGVRYAFEHWTVVRVGTGALLRDPRYNPVAAALRDGRIEKKPGAAKRLFVARKDTRAIINQDEIESLLHPQGFVTVYPEKLTVDQEIRIFIDADEVVAVHGAGLAPIIYRDPVPDLFKLVEINPVGHITDFYRAMLADLNGKWVGVRGYMEPDQVDEIYRLEQPYMKHSLRNFRVDPASVQAAMDTVGIGPA
jgi:capsular polysaccharide biosynthesis protein